MWQYKRTSSYPACWFQFTHPLRGVTVWYSLMTFFKDFNSHTPCGVWPFRDDFVCHVDVWFQFTHPLRGVTSCSIIFLYLYSIIFQFTHPLRGVTWVRVLTSLHRYSTFQFTHPLRGVTIFNRKRRCFSKFQFTHPLRGVTRCLRRFYEEFDFNSHTPCGVWLCWRHHRGRG